MNKIKYSKKYLFIRILIHITISWSILDTRPADRVTGIPDRNQWILGAGRAVAEHSNWARNPARV